MTRTELIRVLMPDFIKRRKIKSLVSEYNIRIRLRNQAYDLATQQPEIVYTAQDQVGESLDRTIKFLEDNISLMYPEQYHYMIEETKAKRQAKAERLAAEEEQRRLVTL